MHKKSQQRNIHNSTDERILSPYRKRAKELP